MNVLLAKGSVQRNKKLFHVKKKVSICIIIL